MKYRTPAELTAAIESVPANEVAALARTLQALCGEESRKDFIRQEAESRERPAQRARELLGSALDWFKFGN